MRNPLAHIKTLVLFSAIAFAGHVLAAPETWFSGTANGNELEVSAASWDTNVVGEVTVAANVLSIDLPTNTVVKLTPTPDSREGKSEKKTYVVVDGAVFTPTSTNDIDSTVVEDAQTALTVAYDDTPRTNYYAYVAGNWVELDGVAPVETPVNVTIELDYSNSDVTNASFKVGETTLYEYGDSTKTSFPISGTQRCLSRIELAGYGKIHSVTTSVEAAVNVTIAPTSVTYGADFTNVTIVAEVSGDGYAQAEYTLNWNGTPVPMTFTPVGTTLTITVPIDGPLTGRDAVTYTINANGGSGGTTGEQNTIIADSREWIVENSTHTGVTGTGTWKPAVAYNETVAIVEDNTYEASNCSTGDLVKITFENLVYTEFSDLSVETPDGTQGAFALAETNINDQVSTNFCILVKEGGYYTWEAAVWNGGTPSTNVPYTVEMAFNYTNDTYSVKVSDGTHDGYLRVNPWGTEFPICVTSTRNVSALDFKGSGTMTGITGVDSIGYMAKDTLGQHWYATIDDALHSDGKEFIILRETGLVDAPSGWDLVTEGGIKKLIKKVAKGLFFMAY